MAHARILGDYVFEDAFITYRYARNLADGLGFVFNPGERVFGTSAPLLTLLLASLARLGIDPAIAGGWISCASLSAAGALGAIVLRLQGYPNAGAVFALATIWAAGNVFAYFGLETALHLALIVAVVLAAGADRPTLTGVLLGLLCWNRYDGMAVAVAVGFWLWARRRRPPWHEAMIATGLFGVWILFAWSYFGSPTPNTLGAKAGDSAPWQYVGWTLAHQAKLLLTPLLDIDAPRPTAWVVPVWLALSAPCILFARWIARHRPVLVLPIAITTALLVGYALIGPPMRHQWYHLPGLYLVLLTLLGSWGAAIERLTAKSTDDPSHGGRGSTATARLPTLLTLAAILATAALFPSAHTQRGERLTDGAVMVKVGAYRHFADFIRRHGLEDTSLLTLEPGFLTYHSRQRAIDAAGLVTTGVYFHGPAARRSSWQELVEHHQPDFLVRALDNWTSDPALREHYVPVTTSAGHYWLWMRRDLHTHRLDDLIEPWLRAPTTWSTRTARAMYDEVNSGWTHRGAPVDSVPDRGFALSQPFVIDFDDLVFDFHATSHLTMIQLLVDDAVVLSLSGEDSAKSPTRRALPVYPWRGRTGRLRLIDRDEHGALRVSSPTPRHHPNRRTIDDFERSTMAKHWQVSWTDAPQASATLARRFGAHFAQGRGVASSLGLQGEQMMFSHPLRVDADRWLMTVYDLGGPNVGVHLWVDGQRVRSWVGRGTGRMHVLMWDMSPFRGREVVLQVRDGDIDPDRGIAVDSWIAVDLGIRPEPSLG
ncbi:MAG: hypothetical protein AAGE94_08610 [Acidobacteriota bacterium]